jgi:hypothetical protein
MCAALHVINLVHMIVACKLQNSLEELFHLLNFLTPKTFKSLDQFQVPFAVDLFGFTRRWRNHYRSVLLTLVCTNCNVDENNVLLTANACILACRLSSRIYLKKSK